MIQRPQKGRIFSVKTICANPTELNPLSPGFKDQLKSKIMLTVKNNKFIWNTGGFTFFPIIGPVFRKVQSETNRSRVFPASQHRKNVHLAIVHFAELATPLPFNSDRFISL